uniref:Uncharacterized protein n=2 Tax=prokaryotic environmental samples TaxID=81490 RepID=B3T5D5_9ZZZZ|nr:hypothetical protein ALOHA_HF4000ANIW133F6ctg1g6 [uncultured marine microorganism HF4000_ANIW133F6]ABZ07794.1 hypothetical protein ALOHA_HF4000ANIW141C7ctg1g28 [uncultured marine microorganism HF4000_ANIW141C7]
MRNGICRRYSTSGHHHHRHHRCDHRHLVSSQQIARKIGRSRGASVQALESRQITAEVRGRTSLARRRMMHYALIWCITNNSQSRPRACLKASLSCGTRCQQSQ